MASARLSSIQAHRLRRLAGAAVKNVAIGLSEMFGADVRVAACDICTVPLDEVAAIAGDPDRELVGVYLACDGGMSGYLLVLLDLPVALTLCDVVLEQSSGTTMALGEMELSALGELGNVAGSFFLNTLADSVGGRLNISPPEVLRDKGGAVIRLALVDVATFTDEAIVIDASFEHASRGLVVWFLVFPHPFHLAELLDREAA
jgi:chemotaxis protein CheC